MDLRRFVDGHHKEDKRKQQPLQRDRVGLLASRQTDNGQYQARDQQLEG